MRCSSNIKTNGDIVPSADEAVCPVFVLSKGDAAPDQAGMRKLPSQSLAELAFSTCPQERLARHEGLFCSRQHLEQYFESVSWLWKETLLWSMRRTVCSRLVWRSRFWRNRDHPQVHLEFDCGPLMPCVSLRLQRRCNCDVTWSVGSSKRHVDVGSIEWCVTCIIFFAQQ